MMRTMSPTRGVMLVENTTRRQSKQDITKKNSLWTGKTMEIYLVLSIDL